MLVNFGIIFLTGIIFFAAIPKIIAALKPPAKLPNDLYLFVLSSPNLTSFCYFSAMLLSYQILLPKPYLALATWGTLAGFIDYYCKFLPKQLIRLGIHSAVLLIITEQTFTFIQDFNLESLFSPLLKAILGSIIWAGIYFGFWLRGGTLGFGDVRLAGLLGLTLGYSSPTLVLFAIGLAGIIAILSLQKGSFAFGPIMLTSTYLIALADFAPLF